jgi:hypothetical protein
MTQEGPSDAMILSRGFDREAGEPKHRQRVARQLAAQRRRGVLTFDLARRDGGVANDAFAINRDVRRANVMTELVLSGVLDEEAIEVRVARAEDGSVVLLPERPNLDRRS